MVKSMSEKIEMWEVKKLVPYSKNSRRHPEKQIEQIMSSIQRFGFLNPILVDTKSGIIAGHGRLEAAKKIGMSRVPVIVVDHLSENEKRAYIIADNKIAENAEWDFEMLSQEVADILEEFDDDLDSIGFTQSEIDKLLAEEDAEHDNTENKEHDNTESIDRVSVKVGEIAMKIDGHRYLKWETDLKKQVGIQDDKQKAEILRRLKIA